MIDPGSSPPREILVEHAGLDWFTGSNFPPFLEAHPALDGRVMESLAPSGVETFVHVYTEVSTSGVYTIPT
ncbi:hypothetical protein F9C07_5949 [Aspergillus flavus]|uniref:Uncharacterized protein n=1 Tax=Aspergillus flavus (strain ATCC 200026 / FGSC A1120 / IAM 13836 / NRRL 3357 / JCM 12722 / SRRC 167) TaxID=332952 RepID=A0A7U2MXY0_ASPFN|nr:hypothetical protein F9C07_5949 [Aspergillus flavus]